MKIEFKPAELKTKEKQFFKSVIEVKLNQELIERFGEVEEDRRFSFKVNWKKSYNAELINYSHVIRDAVDIVNNKIGISHNPVCGGNMINPACGMEWEFFTRYDLLNLVYGDTYEIFKAHNNPDALAKITRTIFTHEDIRLMKEGRLPGKIKNRVRLPILERVTKKRYFECAIPYLKGESNVVNTWSWRSEEGGSWTLFDTTVKMELKDKFGRNYYDNFYLRVPLNWAPIIREYKINQLI